MSLGGSLWLVPHPTSHVSDALQDKIAELSERNSWGVGVSKVFKPHMTITSSITDYFLSQSKSKVDFPGYNFVHLHEIKMLAPELKFKEIVMGELFFKRIFIRLEKTQSLLELVKTLRSQFVGENQGSLEAFMDNFDPHISLAYAEGFNPDLSDADKLRLQKELAEFAQGLELNQHFAFIVLMDTRTKESTKSFDSVKEWKSCPIRLAL